MYLTGVWMMIEPDQLIEAPVPLPRSGPPGSHLLAAETELWLGRDMAYLRSQMVTCVLSIFLLPGHLRICSGLSPVDRPNPELHL